MRIANYYKGVVIPVFAFFSVLALILPLPSKAVSIYTDTPYIQANMAPLEEVSLKQIEVLRIRRLSNYIQKTFKVSPSKVDTIVTAAVDIGSKHNLDPELILAIIAVESTFRERAVSRMGARGLMQVLPRSHPKKVKKIGGVHALFDPKKNISTGSKILVQYLDKSNGNLRRALLRYNGSLSNPRSRYPRKVLGIYNKLKQVAGLS